MKDQRRFVIGDIHGAYRALIQCFERSGFNRKKDMLICLGDVCDSWPEVNLVFDELLQISELVLLQGNHDLWAYEWFTYHRAPDIWLIQGGEATRASYPGKVPDNHKKLLKDAGLYYFMDGRLFVHGGIIPEIPLENQSRQTLMWDRTLVRAALDYLYCGSERNITGFEEVYVGHTPTIKYNQIKPIKACEITMMDTGAGWSEGVLSMMDIDSREVYQSDKVSKLYPFIDPRN